MRAYLTKERLNSGATNVRGRYFGNVRGTSLYRYDVAGVWESGYLRAPTLAAAKEELRRRCPQLDLRFFR